MPKIITSVNWSAQNVPSGLSFDPQTGSFSGTPVGTGEYTIPVTVQTNYGRDTKDVILDVVHTYPVYVIGTQAETWSEGAEADEYGFRKLNMPKATNIIPIYKGFCARTDAKKAFFCSTAPMPKQTEVGSLHESDIIVCNTPTEMLFDEIVDMSACLLRPQDGSIHYITYCVSFLCRDNVLYVYRIKITQETQLPSSDSMLIRYENVIKSQDMYGQGLAFIWDIDNNNMHTPLSTHAIIMNEDIVPKIKKIAGYSTNSGVDTDTFYWLTTDGVFNYENSLNGNVQISELGKIKDFWLNPFAIYSSFFLLNEDNILYAKGSNVAHRLGLPENNVNYSTPTEVGIFDVKTINVPFLLTRDGKLYHTGTANGINIAGNPHTSFTHIFPNYRFHDIAYSHEAGTLAVLLKNTMED